MLADVVQGRCSLVQEDNFGLADEGAGHQDTLALPSGYALPVGRNGRLQPQGHPFDVFVQGGHAGGFPDFPVVVPVVAEEDVVPYGPFHQLAVLQADAHAITAQAGQVHVFQVVLVIEDGAALGLLKAQQQAHQGALSAAGRPHQGHVVSGIDMQVQAVEDVGHVLGIAELETVDGDVSAHALQQLGAGLRL